MAIEDGTYQTDSQNQIIDQLIADAKGQFGEDLNDDELAVIRQFYRPVAILLSEIQEDLKEVLSSAQIDNAEGRSLELLCGLIGVSRNDAQPAVGKIRFSRNSPASVDHTIPEDTIVQTDGIDSIKFTTDEEVTLPAGEIEVFADITATEPGVRSNVGPNAITESPSPPTGIENITNPDQTSGGIEKEPDDELRARAKKSLAKGSSSTAASLISGLGDIFGVSTTSLIVNDGNEVDEAGLPPHSFEAVIQGGDKQEIGQYLIDNKAAGAESYAGAYGTPVTVVGELPNGQDYEISFSRPVDLKLYIDASIEVTDEFDTNGEDSVMDSVVNYVGGVLSSGNTVSGDLDVGDDVLINRVQQEVMDIRGVYDVTELSIQFDTEPSQNDVNNLTVTNRQAATASAIDNTLNFTITEIQL